MKAMDTVKFKPGQKIIKQGDEGDKFYVIGAGTCDITVKGKGSVMKASRGVAFGELALMFHQPRAATVTAEGDVVAWQVDDVTFKSILMNNWKPPVNKKTKACESFLTKVLGENLLFKELAPADRQVTLALTPTPALAPASALALTLTLALTPTPPPPSPLALPGADEGHAEGHVRGGRGDHQAGR
jgi:CRP-like cAMP-binding protein